MCIEFYNNMPFRAATAQIRLDYLQSSELLSQPYRLPSSNVRHCDGTSTFVDLVATGISLLKHGCNWFGCYLYSTFKDIKYFFCAPYGPHWALFKLKPHDPLESGEPVDA